MNAPIAKKTESKVKAKPVKTMPIKSMQKKGAETILLEMPQKLFFKVTVYLADYVRDSGKDVSLSELICDAIDFYIYCDEQNNRSEAEEKIQK